MMWENSHMLVMTACGVIFGFATAHFIHGGNICYDCYLALIMGRRFENGCDTCGVKLLNDRTTH